MTRRHAADRAEPRRWRSIAACRRARGRPAAGAGAEAPNARRDELDASRRSSTWSTRRSSRGRPSGLPCTSRGSPISSALNAGRPVDRDDARGRRRRPSCCRDRSRFAPARFASKASCRPPGRYRWALWSSAPGLSDRHDLGATTVFADEPSAMADAEKRPEKDPAAIAYLKEQQWTNPFATALVREGDVRTSIRVPAAIEPVTGGEALVSAPADGRYASESAAVGRRSRVRRPGARAPGAAAGQRRRRSRVAGRGRRRSAGDARRREGRSGAGRAAAGGARRPGPPRRRRAAGRGGRRGAR